MTTNVNFGKLKYIIYLVTIATYILTTMIISVDIGIIHVEKSHVLFLWQLNREYLKLFHETTQL